MDAFKQWLFEKYLPSWCKVSLLEENQRLAQQLAAARQENKVLQSYVDGLRDGMQRSRIYITGEVKQN